MLMLNKLFSQAALPACDVLTQTVRISRDMGLRRKVRRNVMALNVTTFLRCFMLVIAVIMPYAEYKAGISAGQFLAAEAFFAMMVVLLEVPSGWLGDVWTRRKTIIVGVIFELLGFLIMWGMTAYWHMLLSQAVIAVGMSLLSGTTSAMLYDTLLEARLTRHYRRLEGLRHSLGLYAVGISSLLSGAVFAVAHYGPDLVIGVTCFAVALGLVCSFMLEEPERHKEAVHGHPLKDMAITIDTGVRKDPYIGRLLLMIALIFGVNNAAFWLQQPYYMALDIDIIWFGVLGACGQLAGAVGAQMSHHIARYVSFGRVWLFVLLWLMGSFAVAAFLPGYHAAVMLMGISALYGTTFPLVQDEVNKRVSSARRATLLSCVTLSSRLIFCVIGFGLGGVLDQADGLGVLQAFAVLAFILAFFALPSWVWFIKLRQQRG